MKLELNKQIYQKIRHLLYKKDSHIFKLTEKDYSPNFKFSSELGIGSLQMYELMDEFEETFDIVIPPKDIDDFVLQYHTLRSITIQDVVDYIEKKIIIRDHLKGVDKKPPSYIFIDANEPLSLPIYRSHSILPKNSDVYDPKEFKTKYKYKYKIISNIRYIVNKEAKEEFADIPFTWNPRRLKFRSYCKYFMDYKWYLDDFY